MDSRIKIGVLGAGHQGAVHLAFLREMPGFDLVGFHDPDDAVSAAISAKLGVQAWPSMESLIGACDAIDIVTPTPSHFECAKAALKNFCHIFIEQPVAIKAEELRELTRLVREAKVKAQVGQAERFHPAFLAVRDRGPAPLLVEVSHHSGENSSRTESNVVLDLMQHDLSLVLSLVKSPLKKVSATGLCVMGDSPDHASARLEFHNGAVATLTASHIGSKPQRLLHLYQRAMAMSLDFVDNRVEVLAQPGQTEVPALQTTDPVRLQLEDFARAIQNDASPSVTLEEAALALDVAQQVMEKINPMIIA